MRIIFIFLHVSLIVADDFGKFFPLCVPNFYKPLRNIRPKCRKKYV